MRANTSLRKEKEQGSLTQEEWKTFWEHEYTILRTVALKILRNQGDAEDAVHNLLAEMLEDWKGKERELLAKEQVKGYLVRALKFHCINIIRKRVAERNKLETLHQSPYQSIMEESSEQLRPEKKMLLDELPDHIRKAAGQLSPQLQELCLFLFDHLDAEQKDLWPLWANANDLNPKDTTKRNTFDQRKQRLREQIASRGGIYAFLEGASGNYAKQ